jgi:aminopeptidase YwaD
MKKLSTLLMGLFLTYSLFSQDINYARNVIQKLCSPEMMGRGYVKSGDKKAAYFIEGEFIKFNLQAYDTFTDAQNTLQKKFTQTFKIKASTYPENLTLKLDKVPLVPGVDYIIAPNSSEFKTKQLGLVFLTKDNLKNEKTYDEFLYKDYVSMALVIDDEVFSKMPQNDFYDRVLKNEMRAEVIIFLQNKQFFSWGFSPTAINYPTLYIQKSKFPLNTKTMELTINRKQIYDYETQNVVGYIPGKKSPDSIIVIGAHYDHLGMMGKDTYFQGANDNASGTAMLLDMAKYFNKKENLPDYTLVFIAFGAEEANLQGSKYFTEHPYFPLKNLTFMINLDLMGTGDKGMMVVNGKVYTSYFDQLKSINNNKKYLLDVQSRPAAPISDHAPFYEKGIKSFYFYLLGDYPNYHDVYDKFDKISLAGYEGSFKLITDFVKSLQKK